MNDQPIIYVDRVGIIKKKRNDYVKNINEVEFLPNIFEAIKKINELGFKIIIITNQSVVNRQIISEEELKGIHKYMMNEFKEKSCEISKIYYCPHKPNENCDCRKPKSGLLIQAAKDFNIDLNNSWMIGDRDLDIQSGLNVGCRSIKVTPKNPFEKIISDILYSLSSEEKNHNINYK